MCGIAGIINLKEGSKPSQHDLERMIQMIRHRGPDDYGFYADSEIGLAHARLSIIDIEGGHQPIHDEDSDTWIIFNGEIFNYVELKIELKKDGFKFKTNTDTEVVLQLYKKYGTDFVNYLNGQFAIAIWDKRKRTLILARDRIGITPLFYYKDEGRLLFASEIKSILAILKKKPGIDIQSLDQALTFWTPVAANTMFTGIYELKPGELMTIKDGDISTRLYWDWEYPTDNSEQYYPGRTETDLADELHEKLVEATKIRLRSDVPVAAYLSGGLDSSALVSIIHQHGKVPLRTFSIGFEDKQLDESSYQKKLIQHLNADHSNITCSGNSISDNFEKTIWHTESTILRTAPTPMMQLSGLVHDSGYKVVLTGEGADEVFGGYDIFKEAKIRRFWSRNADSNIRPILLKRLYPYLDITKSNSRAYLEAFFGVGIENPGLPYFSHLPRYASTSKAKMFYSDALKQELRDNAIDILESSFHKDIKSWHPFNQSQYIEAKSLMAKYLLSSQGDRMLMANSVEGRFPFLDHNVIEFANKLNPKLKMKVLNEKYLLKKSMSRYLPEEIINRHKQPYRAPDIPSFVNNKNQEYVQYLTSISKIKDYGYFDPRKVEKFMKKVMTGRATGYSDNMAFMAILSTQLLHYLFVEKMTDVIKDTSALSDESVALNMCV